MANNMDNIRENQDPSYPRGKTEYKPIPAEDFLSEIKAGSLETGNRWLQFAATLSVSLCSMAIGTTYSWSSPALPHLKSNNTEIPITEIEGSWIATLIDVGAFIGNITFLLLSSFLGRKYWILMLAIPYMISWLMIIFAKNIFLLYTSRLISGLAGDFAIGLVPMYIGEIADKEIRGILLMGLRIFSNLGHMYVKTAGAFLPYKTMNVMMFFVPLIFFITFSFMPESPYYLLMKNKRQEALNTLMRLKGVKKPETVSSEFERIENTVRESRENKKWMFGELFCVRGNRKSLIIALTAWVTKYSSGTSAISSFTQEIFEETDTSMSPEICAMTLAIIGVIMSLSSTLIIERVGRKKTFFISGLFCTLGLLIVGLFFFLKICVMIDVKSMAWLPLFGLIVYEVAFSSGVTYVPLILMGEMFALNVKIPAVFSVNVAMSLVTIIIKVSFQWLNDWAGIFTTFWIYAICCFVGSIIFFSIAPETKGKTLEEIQENLHERKIKKMSKEDDSDFRKENVQLRHQEWRIDGDHSEL